MVLSDGKISEVGSYTQLMEHDGPFAQFLKIYFTQGEDSEEEDEDPESEFRWWWLCCCCCCWFCSCCFFAFAVVVAVAADFGGGVVFVIVPAVFDCFDLTEDNVAQQIRDLAFHPMFSSFFTV